METLKTQKSSKQQALNYDIYILSMREWLFYSGQGILIAALFSYIFYRSLVVFLIFIPFGIIVPLTKRKELKNRQLQQLNLEFKEGILLLSSFLSAGYSVENSVISASVELSVLYGKEGLITKEFRFIERQIHMNRSVEQAFLEFALRSGLDDVKNFAEVFSTAKRSGGELVSIISHTADVIRDKVQVRQEILTMTASKQFELKIMNLIPFFIVIYIDFTSPGFFQIMYTTGAGRILMTICMILYMIAYQTAKRIMEIEI
ncbi:tight adherence protein B [Lacrimispora xylanisolvens]|uniref:Tight adherence protein B n=1 Tax=Lacrimispora xylanisolvens TaxID=384636 RepID=A0A2S6HDN8_9FIRM|nr:type II secretion system F family protein [Hungatella xylanolytica]PPK75511.1 tight adherence protein B [Hungatella xylanolytica]